MKSLSILYAKSDDPENRVGGDRTLLTTPLVDVCIICLTGANFKFHCDHLLRVFIWLILVGGRAKVARNTYFQRYNVKMSSSLISTMCTDGTDAMVSRVFKNHVYKKGWFCKGISVQITLGHGETSWLVLQLFYFFHCWLLYMVSSYHDYSIKRHGAYFFWVKVKMGRLFEGGAYQINR